MDKQNVNIRIEKVIHYYSVDNTIPMSHMIYA